VIFHVLLNKLRGTESFSRSRGRTRMFVNLSTRARHVRVNPRSNSLMSLVLGPIGVQFIAPTGNFSTTTDSLALHFPLG
jgi:hypothetical protein